MKEAPYFDEPLEDGLADGDVQSMARRQFSVSLVVGCALLALAALIAVRAPQMPAADMTAHHRVIQPEAPRIEYAQPTDSQTHG